MSTATIIDQIDDDHLGTFVLTEMTYGPERRYGLRQVMTDGKWMPIGGTTRSLEGAYQRLARLISGDPEIMALHKQAQIDHAFRFKAAA